jgi:hypothetical protein
MIPQLDESAELSKISEFKKGFFYFFDGVAKSLLSFSGYLEGSQISESNKQDLAPFQKSLLIEINQLQNDLKSIPSQLDERQLSYETRRDYQYHFPGADQDQNKSDFIIMVKTFEILKLTYVSWRYAWDQVRKTINQINFRDQEYRNDVLLGYKWNPIAEKLDILKVFLTRMAYFLRIDTNERWLETKELGKPTFNPKTIYKFSSLFIEGLYKEKMLVQMAKATFDQRVASIETASKVEASRDIPVTAKLNPILNTCGKFPWNSNSHYIFRFEIPKLQEELELFKTTINIDTHMGAEETMLRSELIRTLTSRDKTQKTGIAFYPDYIEFLHRFFTFCEDITVLNIHIPIQIKKLFMYHIAPSHFYMIAKKFLTEVQTGHLHVKSADGKKVYKVTPNEIIKREVIEYWKINVMPFVGDEKNNLTALKKISEIVEGKYREVSQNAIREYDSLPVDVKAAKPRVQIFREKMNVWMGATNIIVFKRFLKNQFLDGA